jgi:hypothetical protein
MHRNRLVQSSEAAEREVICCVGRVHVRRDRFQQREITASSPCAPLQHLVEESEAFDRGRHIPLAAGRLERRGVDDSMSCRNALWIATTASIGPGMTSSMWLDSLWE